MPDALLAEEWLERIWSVMLAFYGSRFTSMWSPPPGADVVQHVKTLKLVWRRELAGFAGRPDAIAFALDHLPDTPPTLPAFAALCLRRPERAPLALPAPKADPARVHAALARMRSTSAQPPRAWANALRLRELGGERLTAAQREAWRAALRQPGEPS